VAYLTAPVDLKYLNARDIVWAIFMLNHWKMKPKQIPTLSTDCVSVTIDYVGTQCVPYLFMVLA